MTDGGRPAGDDGEDELPEFQAVDPDADPFVWGQDRAPAGEPDGTDASAPGDDRSEDGIVPDRPSDRGTDDGTAPESAGDAAVPESLDRMRQSLDRLSAVAEELNVTTINADIKRARGEIEDLEAVHEELGAHVRTIDRVVERLDERLAEVRSEFEQRHHEVRAEPPATPARELPQEPATERWPLPRIARSRGPASRDADREGGVELGGDASDETTDSAEMAASMEPAEFLIPGTKLRDIWRVTARSRRNGDGGYTERTGERWILETSASAAAAADGTAEADDVAGIPREVTEFTLDPDEISFEELLDLVDVDDD